MHPRAVLAAPPERRWSAAVARLVGLALVLGVPVVGVGCGGGSGARPDGAAQDGGPDSQDAEATSDERKPDQDASVDIVVDAGADAGRPLFGGHRIAAGRTKTCALRAAAAGSTEQVWCWGGINGEVSRPAPVGALPAVQSLFSSGGDDLMCALTSAGDLWCWADGATPAQVVGLAAVKSVAVGAGFSCALQADGTVLCWGKNDQGQLGDGTVMERTAPTAVADLKDVTAIGAGTAHVCAVRKDGGVSCWGGNGRWQLGDGSTIGRFRPVSVVGLPATVRQIAVGPQHTCARTDAGAVWCWGFNGAGQASSAGQAFLSVPTLFEALGTVTEIVGGGYYEFGEYDHSQTCGRASNGAIWCAGRGFNGELGDGMLGREATDTPLRLSALGTSVVDLAIGGQHMCALDDRDQLWCWGRNYAGQLGRDTPASPVPMKLESFGPFLTSVVGDQSTCARTTTGFYCWGDNRGGQLGVAESVALSPRLVPGVPPDVKQWGVGALYTCWLQTTGQVHCMGGKWGKQPAQLTTLGSDNTQLVVGNHHACVLKRDGTLWCWGSWACGELAAEADPAKVTAFEYSYINVWTAATLACAQRTDGAIWCCGDDWGRTALQAPVGTDVVEVAMSTNACARKANGVVLCGTSLKDVKPVAVDSVVQMAISRDAACVRKADGSVWCWGKNARGVLGTGGGDSAQPVKVAGTVPFVDLAGGMQHFCARDGMGSLYCWGDNYVGELGDGLGGDRGVPDLVSFP